MNCIQARRMLSACLDRDLTFTEDEELRRHLRECARCGEEMACLERVRAMLRELPETQPEPGFYEAVCRRIAQERAETRPLSVRPRFTVGGFVKEAFAAQWLRPVAGVAFGLAIGLLIRSGDAPAPMYGGEGATNQPQTISAAPSASNLLVSAPESPAVVTDPSEGLSGGPLADIDLARADSILGEEEYVRDPYVPDTQGRPVRGQVSGNRDAFVTF